MFSGTGQRADCSGRWSQSLSFGGPGNHAQPSKNVVYNLVISEKGGTAHHVVIDRSWIHGTAHDETTRGVMLTGTTNFAVVDSFLTDFHCVSLPAPAPIVRHCWRLATAPWAPISSSTISWRPRAKISFSEAAAREESRRHRSPPQFLLQAPYLDERPTRLRRRTGRRPFIVKNHFELKNAYACCSKATSSTTAGEDSVRWGLLYCSPPENPSACPTCLVRDVTIRYSKFSHAGAAMQIANVLSDTGFAAQEGNHYSIHDIVLDDMFYPDCSGCNGHMFQITTATSASRSTCGFMMYALVTSPLPPARAKAGWMIAGPAGQQNMVFADSIIDGGTYGHASAGGGAVQCYYGKASK